MIRPVDERWFERRDAGHGVTLITEPHVDPFVRCNCWHVRGRDRDVLVDSGLGIAGLRAFAPDLVDGDVVAVASHSHYDHIGGLHEFETRVAHALDAPAIARPGFASLLISDFPPAFRDELASGGEELVDAYPSSEFDPASYRVQPVEASWLVADGDAIELGDRAFEVLHLPGHTPGSIALWEEATGLLFAGDVIYDGVLLDELPGSSIADYVASMRRLRELPVSTVHAGHYPSFGRERYLELIDDYLRLRAR